jgi:hypothetical protein
VYYGAVGYSHPQDTVGSGRFTKGGHGTITVNFDSEPVEAEQPGSNAGLRGHRSLRSHLNRLKVVLRQAHD